MLNSNQVNSTSSSAPRILCTCLYRALCGINTSARLKLNDEQQQQQDPKAFLRSSCLFTFIGRSDRTISICINDREEFIVDLMKEFSEGLMAKKNNLIPNEILILENVSLKNSNKSSLIIHSFSMIVNSGCSEGGGNVHVFQFDILKGEGDKRFNLVISKSNNLCHGKNLIGLRVLNWSKMVGKKKVIDKYLLGITLDGELMIWEEKNLEKPIGVVPLDLESMVVDFALSDNGEIGENEKCGARVLVLDSQQNLKSINIEIGDKNVITINNWDISLDIKSFIKRISSSNNSIFIYEKSNQTHIISNQQHAILIEGTIIREIEPTVDLDTVLKIIEHDEKTIAKWNINRDGMYIHLVNKSNQLIILERADNSTYSLLFKIDLNASNNSASIISFTRQSEFTQIIPPNLLSRFLYTNPVCILSSNHENKRNLMTITWLTPTDNSAHFICSMNKSRHSALLVRKSKRFTLNIPTLPLADYVLKIGGCSGSDIDKFATFVNNNQGSDNNKPLTLIERENSNGLFHCFEECCAHLCCIIEKEMEETCPGHHLFYCRIVEGYVKEGYWKDGKQFIHINDSYPPYLTFLGSQEFALTSNSSKNK